MSYCNKGLCTKNKKIIIMMIYKLRHTSNYDFLLNIDFLHIFMHQKQFYHANIVHHICRFTSYSAKNVVSDNPRLVEFAFYLPDGKEIQISGSD